MPKNTDDFALAPILRLLKQGSNLSVSQEATTFMQSHVTEKVNLIAKRAVELAEHDGRTTVLEKDILLAASEYQN